MSTYDIYCLESTIRELVQACESLSEHLPEDAKKLSYIKHTLEYIKNVKYDMMGSDDEVINL